MKTIIAASTAALFSTFVGAADIYEDMGDGNPDLSPQRVEVEAVVGMQPGVGDGIDRYHGFGDGNPDIFQVTESSTTTERSPSGNDSPVYVGPGLRFQ